METFIAIMDALNTLSLYTLGGMFFVVAFIATLGLLSALWDASAIAHRQALRLVRHK